MANRWMLFAMAAALAAGCASDPDDRPATLEVVTLTVLAPTCGQVQCHSTFTKTQELAFDTVEAVRASLSPRNIGEVMDVIADGSMPPDVPLSDADLALINKWFDAGTPGL